MMSKEEIEDEANEWIRSQGWSEETLPSDEYDQMVSAYVAAAMSREKRIKELEDECDSLKQKSGYVSYMEQRIELGKLEAEIKRLKELQEENNALREKLKEITDYLANDITHKLMNEAITKIWRML